MPPKHAKRFRRKPRAVAQRNRERILDVAKEAFARHGANTSLDDIAKHVGIGPGTLYRHFPAREELLQAVYRAELESLQRKARFSSEWDPSDYPLFASKIRRWKGQFQAIRYGREFWNPAAAKMRQAPQTPAS